MFWGLELVVYLVCQSIEPRSIKLKKQIFNEMILEWLAKLFASWVWSVESIFTKFVIWVQWNNGRIVFYFLFLVIICKSFVIYKLDRIRKGNFYLNSVTNKYAQVLFVSKSQTKIWSMQSKIWFIVSKCLFLY